MDRARAGDLQAQNRALGTYALGLNDRLGKVEPRVGKLETDDSWLQEQVKDLWSADSAQREQLNRDSAKFDAANTALADAKKTNDAQAVSIKSLGDRTGALETSWGDGAKIVNGHTAALADKETRLKTLENNWLPSRAGYKLVDSHTASISSLQSRATILENNLTWLKDALWSDPDGKLTKVNADLVQLRFYLSKQKTALESVTGNWRELVKAWAALLDDLATGGSDGVRPAFIPTQWPADWTAWWKALSSAWASYGPNITAGLQDARDAANSAKDDVTLI